MPLLCGRMWPAWRNARPVRPGVILLLNLAGFDHGDARHSRDFGRWRPDRGDLQPARDRTSFFINPRSETGPVVYQYAYTMVEGKTPADMPDVLAETFGRAIEGCRAVPAGTVGPGYFAPMRVDEFAASRVVEAVVHGLDLTLALGRDPIATPEGLALTAAILDDLLARRTLGQRPGDLADDLAWVLAASGRAAHPDNRLPLIG